MSIINLNKLSDDSRLLLMEAAGEVTKLSFEAIGDQELKTEIMKRADKFINDAKGITELSLISSLKGHELIKALQSIDYDVVKNA